MVIAAAAITIMATAQNERPTNWFIGAAGGLNIGFDGKEYISREFSHSGNGTALDVYFGKFFNNTLGFRAGYQGLTISDQYIDYGKLDYTYAHADLLLRCWEFLVPYVHAGAAKVENFKPAGGIGLMVPIRLSNRAALLFICLQRRRSAVLSFSRSPLSVRKIPSCTRKTSIRIFITRSKHFWMIRTVLRKTFCIRLML